MDRPWIEPRELTRRDYEAMRLPKKYWHRDFDDIIGEFKDKRGKNPAKGMVQKAIHNLRHMYENGLGYYIWGQNGVGKTTSGGVLLKEFKRRGQTCLFLKSEQVRTSTFEDSKFNEDYTLWEWANRVGVLLIDDIGKEYRKDDTNSYSDSKLFDLIRERVSNNRSTFITGNPSPDTLRKMYTKSFTTLFGSAFLPVEARGPDLRMQQAKKKWSFIQ